MNLRKYLTPEYLLPFGVAVFFYVFGKYFFRTVDAAAFPFDGPVLIKVIPLIFIGHLIFSFFEDLPALPLPKTSFRLKPLYLVEGFLCVAYCAFIKWANPDIFVDDAGFILRYLENFSEGYFYAFNAGEGPVFGISGFAHGLLTGLLAWVGFAPKVALLISCYLGIFFTGWILFRILELVTEKGRFTFLLWITVMFGSHSFLFISDKGMETTLHMAIVLAAFYFFLKDNGKWMWLFLSFATISKLDAVPLVLVIGGIYALTHWRGYFPLSTQNPYLREIFYSAIVPMIVWIGFATIVFGGPLPQSAYAKAYFHQDAGTFWFPFLRYYFIQNPYRYGVLIAFLMIFFAHLFVTVERKENANFKLTVFGWGFIGVMLLYYFYNPGERMKWYYALPEMLMLIQLGISLQAIFGSFKSPVRIASFCLLAGGLFFFTWTDQIKQFEFSNKFVNDLEGERMEVGKYIASNTGPQDTIFAGHGLIGCYTDAYVMDYTGLNSKLVTDFRLNLDSLVETFHPDWLIFHNWQSLVEFGAKYNYLLDTSFYDLTLHSSMTWKVLQKNPNPYSHQTIYNLNVEDFTIDNKEISKNGRLRRYIGTKFHFNYNDRPAETASLRFGVYKKGEPVKIFCKKSIDGVVQKEEHVQLGIWDPLGPYPKYTQEVQFDLKGDSITGKTFDIEFYPEPGFKGKIEIIDPFVIRTISK